MAGIYIHIPFCKQACNYCNFHFATSIANKKEVLEAIVAEIEMQRNFLQQPIGTIYFGGGTPSVLETLEIEKILNCIYKNFTVLDAVEITFEANPENMLEPALKSWLSLGINRLSIGVQSFLDEELVWMHRSHNAQEAKKALALAQQYFNNFSIDLIFGSPILTTSLWQKNIETALQFAPKHLSCYALTVEANTPLHKSIASKKLPPIIEEHQAQQFLLLMQLMQNAGYNHYEISNYAKEGYHSQHNSNYWKNSHYLGIGPSAHSYNGSSRSWNVANNKKYVQSIVKNMLPQEIEILTKTQQLNEYIMINLRLDCGFNIEVVEQKWGQQAAKTIAQQAVKYINTNKIAVANNCYMLTRDGKLYADGIAADLFF
jgi:oxygen-independent coproporphyrinogen III oxidase